TRTPLVIRNRACLQLTAGAVWAAPAFYSIQHWCWRRRYQVMNPIMKASSVIGLLFGAAIFATIPISPQVTPSGVELSVDQAQAITSGRSRRVNRRYYRRGYRYARRAYSRGYYYGRPYGYYGGYYSRQPIGGGGGQWYPNPNRWWY